MQARPQNAWLLRLTPVIPAVAGERLRLLILVLLWITSWSLLHGYDGIQQDGRLYTLQALAHLRPEPLSHDVFLIFGSQDRYTVFSPVYATAMRWLGIEPAAATLTFVSQLAFLGGALVLARRIVSPASALLGLTVLIAIPGVFGAARIFAVMESSVTPRMAAEALVLCGLTAALSARAGLALVLIALATFIHPVMAAVGLIALGYLYCCIPRPRLCALVAAASGAAVVALSLAWPSGPFSRFDAEWLRLVQLRSPYLFLANWTGDDWGRAILALATLTVGIGTLASRARAMCQVGLIAGLGGLALTLLTCDLLQLVLFTQLQPWRWLWLTTAMAALLLPAIVVAGWQSGSAGRATALLLAAGWIFSPDPLAPILALAACVSVPVTRRLPSNANRLMFYGTAGLVVVAVAARLAWNSILLESHYYDPAIPEWIRKLASFLQGGLVVIAVAALTVWLASRPRAAVGLVAVAMFAVTACVSLAPKTWRGWTHQQFPPTLVQQFKPWRALIPPDAQVLWPESPIESSLLLNRPDYLSLVQTTGLVFSRPNAMELWRRAVALSAVVTPESFFQFSANGLSPGPSREQLERACQGTDVQFLVTAAALSWPSVAALPKTVWHSSRELQLYRCSDRGNPSG
jgi:hypothetical protein